MANFVESLWESIFTPGPTPPLLLATNATFAALQAVLFALLLATYSVHFVILSALCGALWWAINWFVVELRNSEEFNRVREKTPKPEHSAGGPRIAEASGAEAGDEDGGDTETEGEDNVASRASLLDSSPVHVRGEYSNGLAAGAGEHLAPRPGSSAMSEASGVNVSPSSGEEDHIRKRNSELSMSASTTGTDSEWEKISEDGAASRHNQ